MTLSSRGERFSQVYLQRGEPQQDSPRMRRRLSALVAALPEMGEGLGSLVEQELGVDVPRFVGGVPEWQKFIAKCELRDALDFVTLCYGYLLLLREQGRLRPFRTQDAWPHELWQREVARIFQEENVHYTVDERCGVHFRYDQEFAANQASTIAALQERRYRSALASIEEGMAALGEAPPDGKHAIRATFAAAEGLFRLMFPKAPRLTAAEAQKLEPRIQAAFAEDAAALGAATKSLASFKGWIDAAHYYRHEQGRSEPVQPPLLLTVQLVSLGATFVRWLAEFDQLHEA